MTVLHFDSFALLRYLQKETGSERVRDILAEGRENSAQLLLNVINFGEILYTSQRRFGAEGRMKAFVAVQQMGIAVLPCPNALVYAAAELKAVYSISYADAFALASAIDNKARLVTGDPEFRQVQHLIEIEWV